MPSQTPNPSRSTGTEAPPHPLYNTSYTLHRLSPLHHARSTRPFLSDETLAQHAQRFTSILRGDVLRGVRVGIDRLNDEVGDEEGLGRAGALRGCEWTVLKREERGWREGGTERKGRENGTGSRKGTCRRSAETDGEVEEEEGGKAAGVHIVIRYEKTTYTALLLRAPPLPNAAPDSQGADEEKEEGESSTYLPLLLTRMPAPLRATLSSYLASTFDCRVSALRLSSMFLCGAMETFLNDLQGGDEAASGMPDVAMDVKEIVKDVHLTLSFPPPIAPALKSLDIVVVAADVVRFVRAGEKILRQQGRHLESDVLRSQGRKRRRVGADGEDRDVEGGEMGRGPFMAALGRYLEAQLAMSVGREGEQVVKIACGGFVLAREGRVRIIDLRSGEGGEDEDGFRGKGERAMRGLVARLVGRAAGREEG